MNDFIQTDADKIHYRELADSVRYFKESEEGVSSMCKAMEEMRDRAMAEGVEKGCQGDRRKAAEYGDD